jgi:hypothetical protein
MGCGESGFSPSMNPGETGRGYGPENRFGVFYDVDSAAHAVWVLAIGVKNRNRLLIGTDEYES